MEDEDETIKAGVEEEEEDDDKPKETLDEGDIFNLLHAPQACRTQVQKRTQIILLKEVSRLIRSKFNTHFDKLVAAKEDVIGSIDSRVVESPPMTIKEGGVIATGVDADLDELRQIAGDGKAWMARFQAEAIERYGIPGLKIGFNSVFG